MKRKYSLIVAETPSSSWNYHLRYIEDGSEKYSGGAGLSLCGKPMGWDTKIPVSAYGKRSKHIPDSFCEKCKQMATEMRLF